MSKNKSYTLKKKWKVKEKCMSSVHAFHIVFGITKSISDSINLKIEPIEEILKYKMR